MKIFCKYVNKYCEFSKLGNLKCINNRNKQVILKSLATPTLVLRKYINNSFKDNAVYIITGKSQNVWELN